MGEKKQLSKYFLSGFIGAMIGGMIVAIALIAALSLSGDLFNASGSSQRVIVNDLDAATEVEAVAQTVPPSVVGVKATVTQQSFMGVSEGNSVGSGFIVTSDGYIVTNQHVIDGGSNIQISLDDGSIYDGKVIWSDSTLDLAVIKIDANNLPIVKLGNSSEIMVGETVVAIGNPMGLEYERSVTSGIVSALNRSLMVDHNLIAEDLIQTDATINAGNSGGPLCNGHGEVIGINTYKNYEAEGMGFALPINIVKPIINKIVATGSFKPIIIGISGYDSQQAQYFQNAEVFDEGVYVLEVESGGGADKAGIKTGDIITAIDGMEVDSMLEMKAILYNCDAGDEINVTYMRNGKAHSTDVIVYEGN